MERNLVEKHLLECEMCSDELEGLTNLSEPERIAEIEAELNSKVDQRTSPRIFWLNPKVVYRVAAVAVLTIGVSTLIYYFVQKTTPSTMMSESQMSSKTDEMSDSTTPLEVMSIPKDATEQSEYKKKESKQVERPVAPTIVANKIQIADEVFTADSENEVSDMDEMDEVVKTDSVAFTANYAAMAGQRADALRAANTEARKEELAVAAEGAKMSKKAVVGYAQPQISLENALENYNNKNYQKALKEFNTLYSRNLVNDTVVYYRAMCYYNLKSFADAVGEFQKLNQKTDSEFFFESQWYYALSLIEVGRKSDAKVVFETILQSDSPYREQANMAIEKITP